MLLVDCQRANTDDIVDGSMSKAPYFLFLFQVKDRNYTSIRVWWPGANSL